MIVLIAPEKDIKNETTILNQLFEVGLECYHLRKPKKNYQEHCDYLNQIDSRYHNRIVVHFFHELINQYELRGIHFQEQKRLDDLEILNNPFTELKILGKTISSSFHELEELANCEFKFDYHLLSPVFSSISKKGYEGRGFDVNHIDKVVIGMGGINSTTLTQAFELGFRGVGVLGAVWNTENPIKSFVELKEKYDCHFE
jgi:thiamine-phosphate pyrophosphorylase